MLTNVNCYRIFSAVLQATGYSDDDKTTMLEQYNARADSYRIYERRDTVQQVKAHSGDNYAVAEHSSKLSQNMLNAAEYSTHAAPAAAAAAAAAAASPAVGPQAAPGA